MRCYYWPSLLSYLLVQSLEVNGDGNVKSVILNGHYIKWPSRKTSEHFAKNNRFVPKNIIYTRFQLCAEKVFLAAPRYKYGVPFTLGETSLANNRNVQPRFDTYVNPYPFLDKLATGSCTVGTLENVVDLMMGLDGILWVLDIGISGTLEDHPSIDNDPKVVGFNVATGNIKHLVSLRTFNYNDRSRYQYLAVEQINGNKTMLYVGDGSARSIYVWDVHKNTGSRVRLPHAVVQECKEDPREDVFHIALMEHDAGNYIYFTYVSSQEMFRIKTKNLRNRKHINLKCIVNVGKKPGKMVFVGVGYGSVLYFRIRDRKHLYGWDTKLDLLEENIMMVRKSKDCRTITHVDVDNDGTLWTLESNIEDFIGDRTGCFGPSMLLSSVRDVPMPITNDFNE